MNGAGDVPNGVCNAATYPKDSSAVNAATSVEKLGSTVANVVISGSPITVSTTCITPFTVTISAIITFGLPFNVTPLSVLI